MSEGIAALAALDGEAVPDADDLPAVEEGVLGIPRDRLGCVGPAFLLAYGLGEIEVEARELSVVTDVAVWGEVLVKPYDKGAVEAVYRACRRVRRSGGLSADIGIENV